MNHELKEAISDAIEGNTGCSFRIDDNQSKSGGCINSAYIVSDGAKKFFVKINSEDRHSMFGAESAALAELASADRIRVPKPICHGISVGICYLVIEALDFGSAGSGSWEAMGQQLAQLHRKTAEQFGWHRDNVIGSTPQSNTRTQDCATFFRDPRLRPQFQLARQNGFHFEQAEKLLERVDDLLTGHSPAPSLLHGDLWSGNAGFLEDGTPVIYDPATYYGDRETDLAFSEFFGGFPGSFYRAYQQEWPLPPGYAQRKTLYNLYHALNHANLFGGGYANQAEGMIRSIVQAMEVD